MQTLTTNEVAEVNGGNAALDGALMAGLGFAGSRAGSAIGAMIGSPFGPAGAFVGAMLGGAVASYVISKQ